MAIIGTCSRWSVKARIPPHVGLQQQAFPLHHEPMVVVQLALADRG